jgi:hypothetical protein
MMMAPLPSRGAFFRVIQLAYGDAYARSYISTRTGLVSQGAKVS